MVEVREEIAKREERRHRGDGDDETMGSMVVRRSKSRKIASS